MWTAPCGQALCLAWRRLRSGAVMCLACWCSHSSRLLALMWFARWVLIKYMGSTPVTQKKVLPPRRPTDQHHAISTSATRDALRRVPLALALQSCAAAAAITSSPSPLSGSRARLRSILGGAMPRLVDAAVDHDGPGDPRCLVGDRDRRLLGRHAAEQLRHPGCLSGRFCACRTRAIAPLTRSERR